MTMSEADMKRYGMMALMGLVAGYLASIVVGGSGLLTYIIAGILGSFVGGWLFSILKVRMTGTAIVDQIIQSTIGAAIVIVIARLISK
jgi:uncharacterized membrane protein YeaQ/YmgE (transglycosylase-associated protein family)